MTSALRVRKRGLLVLLVLLALATGSPRKADSDASGCSRRDDQQATYAGCLWSNGSYCYRCEYSYGGGYTTCDESPDGTIMVCYDHQS